MCFALQRTFPLLGISFCNASYTVFLLSPSFSGPESATTSSLFKDSLIR